MQRGKAESSKLEAGSARLMSLGFFFGFQLSVLSFQLPRRKSRRAGTAARGMQRRKAETLKLEAGKARPMCLGLFFCFQLSVSSFQLSVRTVRRSIAR
jgi:hypothetical protein